MIREIPPAQNTSPKLRESAIDENDSFTEKR